jgi:hypothetical protein
MELEGCWDRPPLNDEEVEIHIASNSWHHIYSFSPALHFGYLHPSIHEGGYAALYVIFNIPALMVVSGIAKNLEGIFTREPDVYTSNMVTIALLLLFWLLVSLVIGIIIDLLKRNRIESN